MDDFEGTYAPQSPDLSGFQTSNEPNTFSQTSYYPPQQQSHHFPNQYGPQDVNPESFNFNTHQFSAPHAQVAQDPYQSFTMPANGRSKASASYEDDYYAPDNPAVKGGSGRKSKKAKVEEDICDKLAPGVEEGIEVKTKFPVARIKRIMQADDDVGKVAQVTPTAVSKALELFMISVVTKAANEARLKGSKRVTAAHLKRAVEKEEQLDFLNEIVSKIPDAPTTSKKEKEKEEDSDEGGGPKRRKPATKRRKKGDDDS